MNVGLTVLAFLTGALAGGLFAFLEIPVPAPPTLSGILGIVGIYVGFKLVQFSGTSYDLLSALGLS
ncbi:XapX domain-containing protein [Salinirubellus sp. GCM10025818]|jgi:XapX domain-containing protein|uniref:XapX domain-containing protein n=1 Tax=Salinirubellus TaxID=2162630 RepID=UPI0030CD43D8